MSEQHPAQRSPISGCGILTGLGLVAFGALLLAGRFLDIAVWDWVGRLPWEYFWTFFIIGPGAIMLLSGLVGPRESAGLVIPGCILTTVGLILLGQAVFEAWATWSYAWTLIIASVGLGLFLFGVRTGKSDVRRVGSVMLAAGLIAFVGFAFFFEVLIGVGGLFPHQVRQAVWPALIILAGIFIVISSFRGRRHPGPTDYRTPEPPTAPTPEPPAPEPPSEVTTAGPEGPPSST